MANPKRRHSNSRTGKRRAHDAIRLPNLSTCPHCNQLKRPHRVCSNCGYYAGHAAVQTRKE